MSNYPEGSDTHDAPWNRPDAPEPTESERADARNEVWPFGSWDDYATLNDIINASEHLHTDETCQAVEYAEACDKPNPLLAIPDELRTIIDVQVEEYVEQRAQEITDDIDHQYERDCTRADDEYDRQRGC